MLEIITTPEQELSQISDEIQQLREKAAAIRQKIRTEFVGEYTFTGTFGEKIRLSELFGGKDELILVHNMGRSCRYCTLWADGFNGFVKHIENRAAFVVTSPDNFEVARQFSMERGWTFRLLSTEGTTFKKDMGFANQKGEPQPGVSIFKKEKDGSIIHFSKDYFGPGDDYCSIWHIFDLLPPGKDWEPQYHYIQTQHKH